MVSTTWPRTCRVELAKLEDVGLSYIVGGRPRSDPRLSQIPRNCRSTGLPGAARRTRFAKANRGLSGRPCTREQSRSLRRGWPDAGRGFPISGLLLLFGARWPSCLCAGMLLTWSSVPSLARASRSGQYTRRQGDGTLDRAVPPSAIALCQARRRECRRHFRSHFASRCRDLKGQPRTGNDIDIAATRNYGETANDKANELLLHLGSCDSYRSCLLVVRRDRLARRCASCAIVIPVTILLTLFASWLMGYTINRVSLFALIFSIGILVDDAIVVIENISRHWAMRDGRSRIEAAIQAVAEVGNPTIVATLAVVAALLPMLFVSGLMGPYMSPIPAIASAAMVLSFFVAMIITPWLMTRFGKAAELHAAGPHGEGWLANVYLAVARPILATKRRAWAFLIAVGLATLASVMLFAVKAVTVKLLPFDDKSELQAIIDLPAGSSLEEDGSGAFSGCGPA